ncbi:hypothetical protein VFPPC_12369 [Pochonia chlamydosporia 170]|uniref:Uncharacterized protein n=1 Tax=Pochonia chlamydosporia 170 TaxID=1380566 RepID=A0A179EW54_METCM|nr:hypothetical protein VFPPC_12369 [Pochonia chlamydosporia 170]OAQ57411.1 hypothetical protein VFPPC_12369 [Pochonia chlamydosporia 170]
MRFAALATLAFAALGGATAAPEEHQEEARAPFSAIVCSQTNFNGNCQTIPDKDLPCCVNIRPGIRENVRSVRVDSPQEYCILYEYVTCACPFADPFQGRALMMPLQVARTAGVLSVESTPP